MKTNIHTKQADAKFNYTKGKARKAKNRQIRRINKNAFKRSLKT